MYGDLETLTLTLTRTRTPTRTRWTGCWARAAGARRS